MNIFIVDRFLSMMIKCCTMHHSIFHLKIQSRFMRVSSQRAIICVMKLDSTTESQALHVRCSCSLKDMVEANTYWVVLYDGTRKSAFLLNGIRKNCINFGGFRKIGTLSDTEILSFGGRNMAKVSILLTLILLERKYISTSRTQ